jgi:hypothetical protein
MDSSPVSKRNAEFSVLCDGEGKKHGMVREARREELEARGGIEPPMKVLQTYKLL